MIGFLVQGRVRIKIRISVRTRVRVGVMFNVSIYHIGAIVAAANVVQCKSKETPQLIGLFSPNLVITNFMQCFLYGPIG